MRIKRLEIGSFKNLSDFFIDFDTESCIKVKIFKKA
jgi:hypothetical protein